MQTVKLKAIQREQEKFKSTVVQNSRQMVENIKRSELVKAIGDTLLLRISCSHFATLILPLIQKELDVKLFCLQRLQFLSVASSHRERFTIEELVPIAYYLEPTSYSIGEVLIATGDVPVDLQLIADGVCDVVLISDKREEEDFGSLQFKNNPLNKFNKEIHDVIQVLEDANKNSTATRMKKKLNKAAFVVQRLLKGDALTVRALTQRSSGQSIQPAFLSVVTSSPVRVYKLSPQALPMLPPNIRNAFHLDSGSYLDYDMFIDDIDIDAYREWEMKKVSYYEEFMRVRKEYIEDRNKLASSPFDPHAR